HGEVDVFALNDDGRRQTDCRAVGVLGQDTTLHQALTDFATGSQLGVDVDTSPEAGGADRDDTLADEAFESETQSLTQHAGALLVLTGRQHVDDSETD